MSLISRARRPIRVVLVAAVALAGGAVAVAAPPAAAAGFAPHYAVNRPLCAHPADRTQFRCFAVEQAPATADTPGAYKVATLGHGHIGGYSPGDLAKAYGFHPNAAVTQTVAIVDWYDDPYIARDLNTFDQAYGLPTETSVSFRKVNQDGHASPLPRASRDSTEIALDVEAVRAVCHKCRILLVEADNPSATDLAVAENTAVRLGANEITNSFGGVESSATARMISAFRHPRVVITASTGDDGWYGWDFPNGGFANDGEATFPATDPYVVAVGGTTLTVNPDGSRKSETVWNNNGADNAAGLSRQEALGATGGGCSSRFGAGSWQWHAPLYAETNCGSDLHHRVAADIAAVADPHTGFDVLDRYGHGGWLRVGGTSLSSPIIAAMFALAGGSGGSSYPAASLYINTSAANTFDVQTGGSSFCGGETNLANCMSAVQDVAQDVGVNNPNALLDSPVDCSFPLDGAPVATAPPLGRQCNAMTGYDGPTGVGTPKGTALFKPTSGVGYLSVPTLARLRTSQTFTAHLWERLPNAHFTSFTWYWGDGSTTSTTTGSARHAYARAGRYRVTVSVSDSLHQYIARSHSFAVGLLPSVHYSGPTTLRRGHAGAFTDRGSHAVNTGAHIASVVWHWGDGHSTTASSTHHTYTRTGSYTVTLTIKDTSGVSRSVHHTVKVTT